MKKKPAKQRQKRAGATPQDRDEAALRRRNAARAAAEARWRRPNTSLLAEVSKCFADMEGGHFKALIERTHKCVVRLAEPVTLAEMSRHALLAGNRRCEHFTHLHRHQGLEAILRLFFAAPGVNKLKALRSKLTFIFGRTKKAVLACAARDPSGRPARRVMLTLHALVPSGDALVHDDGSFTGRRRMGPLVRLSSLESSGRVCHAPFRVKDLTPRAPRTEEEVFALAARHGKPGHPEGLFVCSPEQAAGVEPPVPPGSARPVDLVETLAAMIVNLTEASRRQGRVVVTLADATGAVHPVALRDAILRHRIRATIVLGYLPCRSLLLEESDALKKG